MKKTKSLMFRFSMLFAIFAIIILLVAGVATYFIQMADYKEDCEVNIRNVGEYLTSLMVREGEDIKRYQEYYMDNYRDLEIPYDFDDYGDAFENFETLFAKEYPGKVLGVDIELEDTSKEVQEAYFVYTHEYWLLTFEAARDTFHLPYVYYLVMGDDRGRIEELEDGQDPNYNVVYMIDGERTLKEGMGSDKQLYLGDTYFNDREKYDIMWRTWETGEKQNGYMEWDNNWGHTYGYYTPLIIDGEKLGLVVSEVDFATVNGDIVKNTAVEIGLLAVVLLAGFVLLLLAIRIYFIRRVTVLEQAMYDYSKTKDTAVAVGVNYEFLSGDEISALSKQFIKMINELSDYMDSLKETTEQLEEAEQREYEMSKLAIKDSLTGIRNKTAYDREIASIQEGIDVGEKVFGVAMVDMNGLKDINDTYGHEKGDVAIKELCRLICDVFVHSPVFRIGGDEFVVILKEKDYVEVDYLVERFEDEVEKREKDTRLSVWEKASAALGFALYDEVLDKGKYDSVFKRADQAMYKRKSKMKGMSE